MGKKSKLILTGFDDLLEQVKKADGNMKRATEVALKDGADALKKAYESQARSDGVPQKSIDALQTNPPKWSGNRCEAGAGFKLGSYDPENPSGGFIAMFENYGTDNRQTKAGENRGKMRALGFIQKAEKKAAAKVKKAEEGALKSILGGLAKNG